MEILNIQTGIESYFPRVATKICLWSAVKTGGFTKGFILNGVDWDLQETPYILPLIGEDLKMARSIIRKTFSGEGRKLNFIRDKFVGPSVPKCNRKDCRDKDWRIKWDLRSSKDGDCTVACEGASLSEVQELFDSLPMRWFNSVTKVDGYLYHNLLSGWVLKPDYKFTERETAFMEKQIARG